MLPWAGPGELRPTHGPELILIGGGMAASGAALLQPLTRQVQMACSAAGPGDPGWKFAGDAGRRGAGLPAWRALRSRGCDTSQLARSAEPGPVAR